MHIAQFAQAHATSHPALPVMGKRRGLPREKTITSSFQSASSNNRAPHRQTIASRTLNADLEAPDKSAISMQSGKAKRSGTRSEKYNQNKKSALQRHKHHNYPHLAIDSLRIIEYTRVTPLPPSGPINPPPTHASHLI